MWKDITVLKLLLSDFENQVLMLTRLCIAEEKTNLMFQGVLKKQVKYHSMKVSDQLVRWLLLKLFDNHNLIKSSVG